MKQLNIDKCLDNQSKKALKLDFNERSDSLPLWLSGIDVELESLWKYPSKTNLQQRAATSLGVNEQQLLLTNGGDEAIELMFKWAKLNNYQIILPLPAFSQYWVGKDSWQLDCLLIEPNEDLSINLERAIQAIEQNSVLILTSPNNPSGETFSYEQIKAVCQQAKEKRAYVFIDFAYIEFTEQEEQCIELLNEFENILMLRTLSKAYGLAGIRVGYLMGQELMINTFKALALPFNISRPSEQLAQLAFSDAAKLEVRNYCKKISENRQQLVNYLANFELVINDSQANFILIQADPRQLQLISSACNQFNIQIKNDLTGLSTEKEFSAIRIGIPIYMDRLLLALRLALEPELVCFDMDGVLIDTSSSYDQCIIKAVQEFTGKTVTREAVLKVRGKGGFNNDWLLAQELIRLQGKSASIEQVTQVFQKFYLGDTSNKGLYLKETAFLSQQLSEKVFISKAKSLNTAVVTGRPKSEAEQGLNQLEIRNTLLISDDDVTQSKPNPEGIQKAKSYYQNNLVWMLGDAPDDMQAAKSAGAIAIGIGDDNLYQYGADLVLNNVNELEYLL